jgi:hypothetical protein
MFDDVCFHDDGPSIGLCENFTGSGVRSQLDRVYQRVPLASLSDIRRELRPISQILRKLRTSIRHSADVPRGPAAPQRKMPEMTPRSGAVTGCIDPSSTIRISGGKLQ